MAFPSDLKLLRDGRRTWPIDDKGKRGPVTDHKAINAAKRFVRLQKIPLGQCRTVESLKRNGEPVPA